MIFEYSVLVYLFENYKACFPTDMMYKNKQRTEQNCVHTEVTCFERHTICAMSVS